MIEGVGIVSGTGGIGKTQMAIEYVHRFGSRYHGGVFWIDAEQGIVSMVSQISFVVKINIEATLPEQGQLGSAMENTQ